MDDSDFDHGDFDHSDFDHGDLHDGLGYDDAAGIHDYAGDPIPEGLAPHGGDAATDYADVGPSFPNQYSGESWPDGGDGPGTETEGPAAQETQVHFGESDVYDGPHTNDVPADPVTPIGPDGNGWDPVAGEYVHNDYPGSDIYTPGKNS